MRRLLGNGRAGARTRPDESRSAIDALGWSHVTRRSLWCHFWLFYANAQPETTCPRMPARTRVINALPPQGGGLQIPACCALPALSAERESRGLLPKRADLSSAAGKNCSEKQLQK
ncbi:uncharacterized protein LOC142864142 [Microcebus murinus]|uniref:uncharacterized protein LOC142864142 n=1 Tax=Microcebus murinus TaxID=30608 RepID=UPI003F6BF868